MTTLHHQRSQWYWYGVWWGQKSNWWVDTVVSIAIDHGFGGIIFNESCWAHSYITANSGCWHHNHFISQSFYITAFHLHLAALYASVFSRASACAVHGSRISERGVTTVYVAVVAIVWALHDQTNDWNTHTSSCRVFYQEIGLVVSPQQQSTQCIFLFVVRLWVGSA